MKYLILFLISTSLSALVVIDKDLAQSMTTQTESYIGKIKSTMPNKAVIYISSTLDPTFMFIEEVDISISGENTVIHRPIGTFRRSLVQCIPERGQVVSMDHSTIVISTTIYPLRVKCIGDGGNYIEAYSTFLSED